MNLFNLNPEGIAVAQALTDVATTRESRLVSEQLQHALNSRIVIEQAKGVIAESLDLSMDIAFILLRSYARSHNLGLGVVARQLINRDLAPGR